MPVLLGLAESEFWSVGRLILAGVQEQSLGWWCSGLGTWYRVVECSWGEESFERFGCAVCSSVVCVCLPELLALCFSVAL